MGPKKHKPVFIHISKNAGTSIVKAARNAILVAGHRTADSWISENGHNSPLFAVVRNPFDRVVSEYFFRKRRFEAGENNPHLSNLHKSFEDWVIATYRDGQYRTYQFFEQTGVRYNPKNMIGNSLIWFLPQKRWVCSLNGELIINHILHYESLEKDWERFSNDYGIQRALGYHNSSPREQGYNQYYSTRSRKIVEDYFQEDLKMFGYKFR